MRHSSSVDVVMEFMADTGPLQRVSGSRSSPRGYEVLMFAFAKGTVALRANGDTDEVIVALSRPGDKVPLEHLSQRDDFMATLGKIVEYAWWMTNHRGYRDAFQMRLLDLSDRTEVTRQFEVLASVIQMSDVR